MTTHTATLDTARGGLGLSSVDSPVRFAVPAGRALYALIFLMSAPLHFTAADIGYAAQQGVPFPHLLVPASGLLALVGALSILLGYRAKLGAWALILFLVPVTLVMHAFWKVQDPTMAQMQQVMFMKNVSMLGAALLIAFHGAGPLSLDALRARRVERV